MAADGDAFCIQKPVFSMFPQDQHGLPDFPHRGGVGQAGLWGKGDGAVHRAVFPLRIGGLAQDKGMVAHRREPEGHRLAFPV